MSVPKTWEMTEMILLNFFVFSGLVIHQNHHFLTQVLDKKPHSSFSAGPQGRDDLVCISMSHLVTGLGK